MRKRTTAPGRGCVKSAVLVDSGDIESRLIVAGCWSCSFGDNSLFEAVVGRGSARYPESIIARDKKGSSPQHAQHLPDPQDLHHAL
jgi:hypothetical protein